MLISAQEIMGNVDANYGRNARLCISAIYLGDTAKSRECNFKPEQHNQRLCQRRRVVSSRVLMATRLRRLYKLRTNNYG